MTEPSLETLREQLEQAAELAPGGIDLVFKSMFGGVSGYVEGRVFASLSNIGLALKLAPEAQAEMLALEGAKRLRYEPDAPESKQYIVVPERVCAKPAEFAVWVKNSMDFVRSLPTPKPKPAKAGTRGK